MSIRVNVHDAQSAEGALLAHSPSSTSSVTGRDRILREAFDKFVEHGFAAVSMQQIADSAGVTKATLYHHFRDKEDLFLEVMRMGFAGAMDNLARAINSGTTLREKLLAMATYLFSTERVDLARLFGDLHQHVDRERQESFWQAYRRPWDCLEAPIAEGIATGEIREADPGLVARVWYSAIASQVQYANFHNDVPAPDAATAAQLVDLLMDGLTPR
jgi:AcrR family transcriptional regulator